MWPWGKKAARSIGSPGRKPTKLTDAPRDASQQEYLAGEFVKAVQKALERRVICRACGREVTMENLGDTCHIGPLPLDPPPIRYLKDECPKAVNQAEIDEWERRHQP
jgi:hypothetical protein